VTDPDPLPEIKARWFIDEPQQPDWGYSGGSSAEWAEQASRDIPWLVREIEEQREVAGKLGRRLWEAEDALMRCRKDGNRRRELLGRLEWAGGTYCDEAACAECGAIEREGHRPGCEWVKVMGLQERKNAP